MSYIYYLNYFLGYITVILGLKYGLKLYDYLMSKRIIKQNEQPHIKQIKIRKIK